MVPPHFDFTTPEYTAPERATAVKWEANRGIGRSFAYNRCEPEEFYLTLPELVSSFVDIISKNGNLLLNVGPTSTGEIPAIQRRLLEAFGDWMRRYTGAIKGSRPWRRFGDGVLSSDAGGVRFTRTEADLNVFLFPRGAREMTVSGIRIGDDRKPVDVTTGSPVAFDRLDGAIRFRALAEDEAGTCVLVIPGGADHI